MLIFWLDMDLVISQKSIHKRKYFVPSTIIYNLVNERCGLIILWTFQIHIVEVIAHSNVALFFCDRNEI